MDSGVGAHTLDVSVCAICGSFLAFGVRALPAALIGDACSADGYYESIIDDREPWIFYDDVSARRLRFTLLHELVRHLVATVVPDIDDELDELGG